MDNWCQSRINVSNKMKEIHKLKKQEQEKYKYEKRNK